MARNQASSLCGGAAEEPWDRLPHPTWPWVLLSRRTYPPRAGSDCLRESPNPGYSTSRSGPLCGFHSQPYLWNAECRAKWIPNGIGTSVLFPKQKLMSSRFQSHISNLLPSHCFFKYSTCKITLVTLPPPCHELVSLCKWPIWEQHYHLLSHLGSFTPIPKFFPIL